MTIAGSNGKKRKKTEKSLFFKNITENKYAFSQFSRSKFRDKAHNTCLYEASSTQSIETQGTNLEMEKNSSQY